jgi:hypothetical protein
VDCGSQEGNETMKTKNESVVRADLKDLLYQLAKESDHPEQDLQALIREVIHELYEEILAAAAFRKKLKLIVSPGQE